MQRIIKAIFLPVVMVYAMGSTQLHAAGFALVENSASGQGNAFAGAAAVAGDASTVWFNPAGMMRLQNDQLVVAGHLIVPQSDFNNGNTVDGFGTAVSGPTDDGGSTAFVPNLYYVRTLNEAFKFGFGVNTPFGLSTHYNDAWVGRYHAVETSLLTINANPNIAYQANERLAIGGGIDVLFADITLSNVIDFGALTGNPQGADGFAKLEADNYSSPALGYNLSLLYQMTERTRVGLAYRSEITIDVEGNADFKVPSIAAAVPLSSGAFVDTALRGSVDFPQSLSASVAHAMHRLTVLGDVTWTGWSSFSELRIVYSNPKQPDSVTTEGWEDALRYSIGVNYRYRKDLLLRAGLAYDETPVPSIARRTARIPGNSRRWISLGFAYDFNPDMRVDVGYSHLFINDTPINNTFESSQAALNGTINGTYNSSIDILSVQWRWNFE